MDDYRCTANVLPMLAILYMPSNFSLRKKCVIRAVLGYIHQSVSQFVSMLTSFGTVHMTCSKSTAKVKRFNILEAYSGPKKKTGRRST